MRISDRPRQIWHQARIHSTSQKSRARDYATNRALKLGISGTGTSAKHTPVLLDGAMLDVNLVCEARPWAPADRVGMDGVPPERFAHRDVPPVSLTESAREVESATAWT